MEEKNLNKSEETVAPGKFVEFAYKVYDVDGDKLLFEAPIDRPDVMIAGVSQEVIPALVSAMEGLKAGDRFETTLPPEAAFGPRSEENVMELDKEIFMRDGKLADEVKVGAWLPMMTAEGFRVSGRIMEIGDDKVKMDFNHPFAGLTVKYDGEIVEVRDATPEELQPVGGCGCGHDHCGDHEGGCCGGHHDHEGGCCGSHHHDQEGSCKGGCC